MFFSCKIIEPSILHRLLTATTGVRYIWLSEQPVFSVTGDNRFPLSLLCETVPPGAPWIPLPYCVEVNTVSEFIFCHFGILWKTIGLFSDAIVCCSKIINTNFLISWFTKISMNKICSLVFVGSNVDFRNCLKIEPRIKKYCVQIKNPHLKLLECQRLILKLNR